MDISRSSSVSRWVTAPRCATSMSLATICGCLGLGRNAKMKSNGLKYPYLGDHIRANVIGAVCPASGECCMMIFDGVDTDVFQYYLDFLQKRLPLWTPNVDCSSLTTPVGTKLKD